MLDRNVIIAMLLKFSNSGLPAPVHSNLQGLYEADKQIGNNDAIYVITAVNDQEKG